MVRCRGGGSWCETARGSCLAGDATVKDDGDLVGASERELVCQRMFKPRAAGGGLVKDAGVGDLKLTERELVTVATLTILPGQRRGQHSLPAIKERADMIG